MTRVVVESVTSWSQLQALEGIWNGLLARSGTDTIFLTFEWVTSWLSWIGQDADAMVLVAKDDAGNTVGIAPLMITESRDRTESTRHVEFIGAPNSDYSDFIVVGDRAPVLQAFFRHLLRTRHGWKTMCLREISETSPTIDALHQLRARGWFPAQWWPAQRCPTLLLENHGQEICRELARKKYIGKRDWEKSVEYAERFGAVSFQHATTVDEAEAMLPHLFRLHRQRWAGTSKFENQQYEGLYRALLSALWEKGRVAVSAMTLDAKPIAVSFAFPYKEVWTNHTWVHDREFGKLSPGTLLVHFMIRDALERGYREFDFTRGAEPYKERFSNHVRQNRDLVVYGNSRDFMQVRISQLASRGRQQLARHPRLYRGARVVNRRYNRLTSGRP